MSRIGKLPVQIPEGITVKKEGGEIKVSNKKNQELSVGILKGIEVEIKDGEIQVLPGPKSKQMKSNWGTMRAVLQNTVKGLDEGFQKTLVLEGVGYRIKQQGEDLELSLGYSHPVKYKKPEGIEFEIGKNNRLTVKGFDKQQVGEVAAEIRNLRPVEPYKGKGFHYSDEIIRRKAGKKAMATE